MLNVTAPKSLAARCSGAFPRHDRERGGDYFLFRRVLGIAAEGGRLTANVVGSRRKPYRVAVTWDGRPARIGVSCTCPRFADLGSCKHLWAAILSFDAAGLSERVPGTGSLLVAPSPPGQLAGADEEGGTSGEIGPGALDVEDEPDSLDDELDELDVWPERAADAPSWAPGRSFTRRAAPPPGWRTRLAALRRTLATAQRAGATRIGAPPPEIFYVVDREACLARGGRSSTSSSAGVAGTAPGDSSSRSPSTPRGSPSFPRAPIASCSRC